MKVRFLCLLVLLWMTTMTGSTTFAFLFSLTTSPRHPANPKQQQQQQQQLLPPRQQQQVSLPLHAKATMTPSTTTYPDPALPNYCAHCGSANMRIQVPEVGSDERPRACCDDCNAIVYVNPKVVVATVVLLCDDNANNNNNNANTTQVLLAQRAIEPRAGYWGIPQGFMELGETSRQAAVREVYEETGVTVDANALQLRAVYNIPGSVQLVYQAVLRKQDFDKDDDALPLATKTAESTAVKFFHVHEALPDLCFPTVQWAIDHCVAQLQLQQSPTTTAVIQQKTKVYNATTNTWGEYEDKV